MYIAVGVSALTQCAAVSTVHWLELSFIRIEAFVAGMFCHWELSLLLSFLWMVQSGLMDCLLVKTVSFHSAKWPECIWLSYALILSSLGSFIILEGHCLWSKYSCYCLHIGLSWPCLDWSCTVWPLRWKLRLTTYLWLRLIGSFLSRMNVLYT